MERPVYRLFAICATYLVVFALVYVVAGSHNSALEALMLGSAVTRPDVKIVLWIACKLAAALGFLLLPLFNVQTLKGATALGIFAAMAACGMRVFAYMGAWQSIAFTIGFAGGLILFVLIHRWPAACALFSVELTLASAQAVFLVAGV